MLTGGPVHLFLLCPRPGPLTPASGSFSRFRPLSGGILRKIISRCRSRGFRGFRIICGFRRFRNFRNFSGFRIFRNFSGFRGFRGFRGFLRFRSGGIRDFLI